MIESLEEKMTKIVEALGKDVPPMTRALMVKVMHKTYSMGFNDAKRLVMKSFEMFEKEAGIHEPERMGKA